MQMAFKKFGHKFEKKPDGTVGSFYYFDNFVDAMYCVDIVISFFSSYMDTRLGDEIYKPSLIAKHYFKNGFIWDFLSVVPVLANPFIEGEGAKEALTLLQALKLLRVFRIGRLIETMNASFDLKTYAKMVLVGIYLCLWFHTVACFLTFLVKLEK
jgi:hypothetical protein